MKLVLIGLIAAFGLSACGYFSSRNNELIGQVKKIESNTPILCPDFNDVDISLGVIRNGVGSMSSQDKWLYVPKEKDFETLKSANESGAIVKITYDTRRFPFCEEREVVSSVELAE